MAQDALKGNSIGDGNIVSAQKPADLPEYMKMFTGLLAEYKAPVTVV